MSKRRKNPPGPATPEIAPVPAILDPEAMRRRRRRRLLFVGAVLVAIPLFELISYQVRAITVTLVNASEAPIRDVRVEYTGGSFKEVELAPGGAVTRVIRPDYSFKSPDFSSYRTTIRFGTADGGLIRQFIRVSSMDYTARETYTIRPSAPGTPGASLVVDHTTEPGFPLGEIRAFLKRLGLR